MSYIGRFAPSPTGPLHFGSLIAAVASYCDAKKNNGRWLIRMEDSDKPRELAGASDSILRSLEAFGFEWHDEIVFQSQRSEIYENVLTHLKRDDLIYACLCSRKEIADSSILAGLDGAIYPKTCFKQLLNLNASKFNDLASRSNACSWRINTDSANIIHFYDAIQGNVSQTLSRDVGDFILKRKDGFFAYQLAVVVDDAAQGVTHIVRGADLLDSTARQIYLQQLLCFSTPHYAHIPVATNNLGEKLSKQTLAKPIDASLATKQLFNALDFLGQMPPIELRSASLDDSWRWALTHWNLAKVPKQAQLKVTD